MAYTVKEFCHFLYPHIGQSGVSRLINAQELLFQINHALNMVYNYNGYIRTRTHRKDAFSMNGSGTGSLLSRWPVRKVDKFRTSKYTDVDKLKEDPCVCPIDPVDQPVINPCCECSCKDNKPCEPLVLDQILPQNQLCAGQYQISGSYQAGMGGFDGRIVKVNTGKPTEVLWMSYFCGPLKLEKYSDIIPVPDSFIHVLAWIIAANIVPMRGASRAQEDLNLHSLYRKELDYLRAIDNIHPKKMEFESPIAAQAGPLTVSGSIAW